MKLVLGLLYLASFGLLAVRLAHDAAVIFQIHLASPITRMGHADRIWSLLRNATDIIETRTPRWIARPRTGCIYKVISVRYHTNVVITVASLGPVFRIDVRADVWTLGYYMKLEEVYHFISVEDSSRGPAPAGCINGYKSTCRSSGY
ncbi:hypothetical protein GGX14DRAFT_396195 [Mycena pura]|uniref:Uncharacterized protein n=1 Tax=Mycena pura TaxID=153505 RepID=A0AAD6VB74_9AGAR|nr:hypothetical protein GGX14DRAFT_396195 [Mycena pura]